MSGEMGLVDDEFERPGDDAELGGPGFEQMFGDPLWNDYCINVQNCRAMLSRRVDLPDGDWSYEPVSGWEQLEDEAADAIEAQGAGLNMSGLYFAPAELVSKVLSDST